jgi:hypothetical protein
MSVALLITAIEFGVVATFLTPETTQRPPLRTAQPLVKTSAKMAKIVKKPLFCIDLFSSTLYYSKVDYKSQWSVKLQNSSTK